MKWILFGHNGWLGDYFAKLIQKTCTNVTLICPKQTRIEQFESLVQLLDKETPDRVISFAGRTSGGEYKTIDFLELPGKHIDNVRDNLIGPMTVAVLCSQRNIHFTYLGTGCIFEYDDKHTVENNIGFKESDQPNFTGSKYSLVKGHTDQLMQLFSESVLNVRIRMPILPDSHPRNLISKLIKYDKICSIPNSVSVLSNLLPLLITMIQDKQVGTINLVNPGLISHNAILDMYKEIVEPKFTYKNFTLDEQSKILKAARSNNFLDTKKLESLFPQRLLSATDATRQALSELKQSLDVKPETRTGLEIFRDFIVETTDRVSFLLWKAPKDSRFTAVIIEPREHPFFEYVINNVMFFLQDKWSLHVFHGTNNEGFVRNLISKNQWDHVHLHSCKAANLTAYEYNNLLMSSDFWDALAGSEKVLIFQTDVILRRFGIEKFQEYDYVGAPFGWEPTFFGNGGFSLRDIPKSKYIITNYKQMEGNEDVHFSKRMRDIQANLPTVDFAREFSVEQIWHDNALGGHAFYNYHSVDRVHQFLQSITYMQGDYSLIWKHLEKFKDNKKFMLDLMHLFGKQSVRSLLFAEVISDLVCYTFLWFWLAQKERRQQFVPTLVLPHPPDSSIQSLCQRLKINIEFIDNWLEDADIVVKPSENADDKKGLIATIKGFLIQ